MKVVLMLAAVLLPYVSAGILGGLTPVNVNIYDHKVGFASKAINDYFASQNSEPHQVAEVISATRQVVSGILYRLKLKMTTDNDVQICDIQVTEQVWMTPSLTSSKLHCEPEAQPLIGGDDHDYLPHGKSSICGPVSNGKGMVGGQFPIRVNLKNDSVVFATSAINNFYKTQDANAAPRTAVKVLCATSQVVAGVLYRYKIEFENGNNAEICDVQVLSQPWVKSVYTATNIKCAQKAEVAEALLGGNPHGQHVLFGGEEDADLNDPMVQKALSLVVDRFNMQSNSMYRAIPSGGKVTKQIVAGTIYRFKELPMMETSCRNNQESVGKYSAEDCAINANSKTNYGKVNAKVYWTLDDKYTLQEFEILKL